MSRRDEMLKQLQPFMRKSAVYRSIFEADRRQLDNNAAAQTDLQLQFSIDTATWALSIYESELGIPVDTGRTLLERRSVIKSKLRGSGKVDAALIKIVADSFTNGNVEVSFTGKIGIKFSSVFGIPSNIEDLKNELRRICPAHLDIAYSYKYTLYNDIKIKNITYDDIKNKNITYQQLLNGGLE